MSVERRSDGKTVRWRVRWRTEGGQRSRVFDLKRDADAFDRDMRRRAMLGAHAPAEPPPTPLVQWIRHWWDRDSIAWARSTRLQRAAILDRWIIPWIGNVRLRDLGPARVRDWRAEITRSGCPPTSANHALSILSATLGAAVGDGLLPANPCSPVRKLPITVQRPRALTPIEVERLRDQMPTMRDAVLVSLLAYAGLRPGEALALTWESVGNVLVIDRSFTLGEMKSTKTNRRRTVEVVEPLAADLDAFRRFGGVGADLVCAGLHGQPLDLHNWTARVWKPACKQIGLIAVPYDGRHTYASLLIHEGRSTAYVAAALGHASATTTLHHYAHLFDEARLQTGITMTQAIRDARAELARS